MKFKRKTLLTSIISILALCLAIFAGILIGNNSTRTANAEEIDIQWVNTGNTGSAPSQLGEFKCTSSDFRTKQQNSAFMTPPSYAQMVSRSITETAWVKDFNNGFYVELALPSVNDAGIAIYFEWKWELFVPARTTLLYAPQSSANVSLWSYSSKTIFAYAAVGYLGEKSASELNDFSSMVKFAEYSFYNPSSPKAITSASVYDDGTVKEIEIVNDSDTDKIITRYFGAVAAIGTSTTTYDGGYFSACPAHSVVKKEVVVPEPETVTETYDGTNKWLDQLSTSKYSWIDNDTYFAKDGSNNPKYVEVKKIEYTDTKGTKTNLGTDTSKIVDAGTYAVTLGTKNVRWIDDSNARSITDKTFNINVTPKTITDAEFVPTVDYEGKTFYNGTETKDFPKIKMPSAWEGKGTLKWDDNQTLGKTGKYNWTFTPTDKNTAEKKGSTQITVTQVAVGSISATYTGSGNVYTSTKLSDLLNKITVTKTNNNGSDGGTADVSEIQFAVGTTLTAGENVSLTVQLKADTSISCTVTIPKILAVVPAELIITHDGSTVYTTTDEDTLRNQLTVKIKKNDGSEGTELDNSVSSGDYTFDGGFSLTSGDCTLTLKHKYGTGDDEEVTGSVTIPVATAAVFSVTITDIEIPDDVTLWEGDPAALLKKYLTVKVVFKDDAKTEKVFAKDSKAAYSVTVNGSNDNTLVSNNGKSNITVTYGGKTSLPKDVPVSAVTVSSIYPSYSQTGTIYSSAKITDIESAGLLTVSVEYNDESSGALTVDEYELSLPVGGLSSTNNKIKVAWKKDKTKTAEFEVTVTDVAAESVSATYSGTPDAENEADDLKSGLTVTLTNNDGSEKTLTASEYTVEVGTGDLHDGKLCAGTITVTVKYSDDISTTVSVTVAKADINMSGVKFEDKSVTYDGEAKSIELSGTLPEGVTVKYSYNGGEQSATAIEFTEVNEEGYEVKAHFIVADTDNYNAIADKTAKLIISAKPVHDMSGVEIKPEGGESESGLKPDDNGGYTGTYTPGGYDVGVKPEDLPSGVDIAEKIIKKKNPDGTWTEVPAIDGAGDYEVTIKFDGGDDHAPIPDMTTPVHIDKADPEMDDVVFKPVAPEGGESGLKPSANGGFTGTYSPEGGLEVSIPETDIPAGVKPKTPVVKKYTGDGEPEFKADGTPANPELWEEVPDGKIDGAGEYYVEIGFEPEDENYNPVDPVRTTVSVGKGTHDMTDVKPEPVAPAGGESGLKPNGNGGYTGTYKPGEKFEVEIKPEDLPDGVSAEPVIKKYVGEGTPEFKADGTPKNPELWQEVPEISEAGEYIYEVAFTDDNGDNYNEIPNIITPVSITDATITGITVKLEDGAEFDIENTLDDIKAKLAVTAELSNGTTEDVDLENVTLANGNLRDGKLDLGDQTIVVTYKDGDGNTYDTTMVINVGKHKLALPVYIGTYAYTSNAITPKLKDFEGFDREKMTFVEDKVQSGTDAGVYRVVFALKDEVAAYYEWAGGNGGSISPVRVKAVEGEEEILPELTANEAAVNWNIAKAKITASWKSGEKPAFQSESYKGSFDNIIGLKYFTDETAQTEIESGALQAGSNYYIVTQLLDGNNFELEESAETIMDTPLLYTHPRSAIAAFFAKNWLWLVIAAAVLLIVLAIIIGAIVRRKHKAKAARLAEEERIRAEKLAEEERIKAEKREAEERERAERKEAEERARAERKEAEERRAREEERRMEREERMMRMQQPQMPMPMPQYMAQPQYMPQPQPQYLPQPMAGGMGGNSEISALRAEISAMRAEANAKEMSALRNEMTNMRNDMTYVKRSGEAPVMSAPAGVSARELSEIIATAVKSAVAGVMPQRETRLTKAREANRATVVKSETAQPVTAVYPPDAVTTTVTTTRVDTTKKPAEQPISRDRAAGSSDRMVFDVGGFYDPVDDGEFTGNRAKTRGVNTKQR